MGEQKTANLPDEYVEMLNFMKNIYSDPVVREQMEMHMKAKRETERPHVAKSPMDTDRVNLEKQQDKVGTQLASKANINRNMKEL